MALDRRELVSVFPLAALAFAAVPAHASTADAQDILSANTAFEVALSRLDVPAMERLSLQEPYVVAIHPGARDITLGWDAVRKSWVAVAERFQELSVRFEQPQVFARDNLGWVTGTEVVEGKRKSGESVRYSALTFNMFERRAGRWLLAAHLTSRVPAAA